MADSEGRFPPIPPCQSYVKYIQEEKRWGRQWTHRKEWSITAQSGVEVSGTVSDCDVGRMSSLLLWCSHCAPTVLWNVGSTDTKLSWGISGEQAGLQPRGEAPHLTTRSVPLLLTVCTGIHVTFTFHKHRHKHTKSKTKTEGKAKRHSNKEIYSYTTTDTSLNETQCLTTIRYRQQTTTSDVFFPATMETELLQSISLKSGAEDDNHAQNMLRVTLLWKAQLVLFVLMKITCPGKRHHLTGAQELLCDNNPLESQLPNDRPNVF